MRLVAEVTKRACTEENGIKWRSMGYAAPVKDAEPVVLGKMNLYDPAATAVSLAAAFCQNDRFFAQAVTDDSPT